MCRSGFIGFSPEPHLHLTGMTYQSGEVYDTTVRVKFSRSTGGKTATYGGGGVECGVYLP